VPESCRSHLRRPLPSCYLLSPFTTSVVISYESVDGKFVRRERDHDPIIGYDDVNQLFWYHRSHYAHRQGMLTFHDTDQCFDLPLSDSSCRANVPPARCFMCFDRIDRNCAFFKKYYEKWLFGHLLVNFNRIWVLHISLF
jgi:1,3-beta-glucan synthase